MSVEENKAIALRVVEEFWNKGILSTLDEIAAPNFVHQLNTTTRSLDTYKQLYADAPAEYPEQHFTVQDTVAEGDKVVLFWLWRGTVAKTGTQMKDFPGITLFYFVGGKVKKILSCHDTAPFQ
jgi:predicted ester cyclase